MVRGSCSLPVIALALGGCSLIYDPDRLPGAATDAGDDDGDDGGGGSPLLIAIEGGVLEEGRGVDGSRPAVLRVTGQRLRSTTTFRASWVSEPGNPLDIIGHEVRDDGTAAVLALALAIDPGRSGGPRTLEIRTGDGTANETVTIDVAMLPELTLPAQAAMPPFLYSRIRVAGPVHVGLPNNALILRSVSSIAIDATIDVDAVAEVGGAGACSKGLLCPGSGKPGGADQGGGGGGFGTDGTGGELLGAGGDGGAVVGQRMLAPFGAEANRGQPGGGGFDGTNEDALPGGGGGALALWAGGDVTVAATARVSATGGSGSGGISAASGGGGGGGSGGAVLVHAGGRLQARSGAIDCPGGEGGADARRGGEGGEGRVRVDAGRLDGVPGQRVDDLVGAGVAYRGPSFDIATPVLTRSATLDLAVLGPPTEMLTLTGPFGMRSTTTDLDGLARFVAVPVTPGIDRLCVTVAGTPEDALGRDCVEIAAP